MAHRLAPGAEVELDEIWFWTAKESGSIEIADRLIDSLTERFFMLGRHPHVGRPRDDDLRPGLRSFPELAGCGYCKTTQIPRFCGMPLRPAIT
jgi:plasmid stabilization system protein ParE